MAKVFTITEGLENLGALKTGGQGSVYKGRRIGEIITAVKLLPTPVYSESTADKNFTAFQNEVQKLKKVNEEPNPNVVKIISSGITNSGNFPYIEMEFIEGPDLEELLKPPHDPVFAIKEVIKLADHLSCALAHCHKAGVRHGDIKSNNVKYNAANGNYVLLDFGLSAMPNEQRRTSLRHAGAIEFMAPEQNEGEMLFQTDVYSFGVILFELIAGKVPFPLNDRGETARNKVMLAHLETLPPDVLSLRLHSLPSAWSEQKKKEEMQVPDWLTNMMYKCLEKKPADRYIDGEDLHRNIKEHIINKTNPIESDNHSIAVLQQENKRLRREKEQLQQQLLQVHQPPQTSYSSKEIRTDAKNTKEPAQRTPEHNISSKKTTSSQKKIILSLVALVVLSVAFYYFSKYEKNDVSTAQQEGVRTYKIIASQAFLFNKADNKTRRNDFAIPGNETIKALDEKNGFIYASIKTAEGSVTKGWLQKNDLLPLEEWTKTNASSDFSVQPNEEVSGQLHTAKQFLNSEKTVEALIIYSSLAKQQDPEAMYEYGKLALQNRNDNIDCEEAFDLIKRAGDKGYIPAKRTLGFLYSFAENKGILQQNNYYNKCKYSKNLLKGSKLLMEAMLKGDTESSRLLDELNAVR
jgi:serine/threonine protein kinase